MSVTTDLQNYHRKLEDNCPMGDVKAWKLFKALAFAALVMISQYITLSYDADPTFVFGLGIAAFLVLWGAEVKEIEIASWFSMAFKNDEDD